MSDAQHEEGTPRKRPGRKPGLSREFILAQALSIANDQGLDSLTLRRLAKDLNVAPMAIYRYFRSKDELLSEMFDYVSSLPDLAACADEDWRVELCNAYAAIRANLVAHPGILPMMTQRYGAGEMTNKSTEQVLQIIKRSGAADELRARTNYALIAYTVGFAVLESAVRHQQAVAGIESDAQWIAMGVERMAGLPVADFPERVGLAPYIAEFVSDGQFLFGLKQIMQALD